MTAIRTFNGPRGSYLLRLATPDDASIVAHHRASMFRDMKEVDDPGGSIIASASEGHLAVLMKAGEYFGFLAEHERQVVGGGGVWLRPLLPRPGRLQGAMEAYVLNVYTEPEHRRNGVARAIMEAIIEWSHGHRVARITLHASEYGQPLYESLGFAISNEMRINLEHS